MCVHVYSGYMFIIQVCTCTCIQCIHVHYICVHMYTVDTLHYTSVYMYMYTVYTCSLYMCVHVYSGYMFIIHVNVCTVCPET